MTHFFHNRTRGSGDSLFLEPQFKALLFVSKPRHANPSSGLQEWDQRRDDRIDDGNAAGPAKTTVHRWRLEFSRQVIPWQQRTEDALLSLGEPECPARPQKFFSGGDLLFYLLCLLGTRIA